MDEMFQLLWENYRRWSDTSARLKNTNTTWKRNVLLLTIGGTALATLGPFAGGGPGRILAALGATALALATYFGRELLDAKHQDEWTHARAAAEAFKSEGYKYLVQAAPYDTPDRVARLEARINELNERIKNRSPDNVTPQRLQEGMPTTWWTVDDYTAKRVQQQIDWYRETADKHSAAFARGRSVSLGLGAAAVILGAITGATANGPSLWGSVLGVVTTAGGSIGAYLQGAQYEATALKYRQTADALKMLKAKFTSAPNAQGQGDLVSNAEAIMAAESAAWLAQMAVQARV